jgi:hypothetical protein
MVSSTELGGTVGDGEGEGEVMGKDKIFRRNEGCTGQFAAQADQTQPSSFGDAHLHQLGKAFSRLQPPML